MMSAEIGRISSRLADICIVLGQPQEEPSRIPAAADVPLELVKIKECSFPVVRDRSVTSELEFPLYSDVLRLGGYD